MTGPVVDGTVVTGSVVIVGGGIAGVSTAAAMRKGGFDGDIRSAPWKHKVAYLLRPPGWSHDGSRETSEQIRARCGNSDPGEHGTAAVDGTLP